MRHVRALKDALVSANQQLENMGHPVKLTYHFAKDGTVHLCNDTNHPAGYGEHNFVLGAYGTQHEVIRFVRVYAMAAWTQHQAKLSATNSTAQYKGD